MSVRITQYYNDAEEQVLMDWTTAGGSPRFLVPRRTDKEGTGTILMKQ